MGSLSHADRLAACAVPRIYIHSGAEFVHFRLQIRAGGAALENDDTPEKAAMTRELPHHWGEFFEAHQEMGFGWCGVGGLKPTSS